MKSKRNIKPPSLVSALLRWFCDPELLEEIEGDLLERFQKQNEKYGLHKARFLFIKEVLGLFRPGIVGNTSHLLKKILPDMKKFQWLLLIVLNLIVTLCIFLPFLPGPYDRLSYGLSVMAQLTGFIGLILVPVGALWLIQEIKNLINPDKPVNNRNNGYYYAISAICIFTLISLILVLILFATVGLSAGVIGLLLLVFVLYRLISSIRELKKKSSRSFNAAPLYLLSIPLIAFAIRSLFIGPVSDYGRTYAVKQAEKLIYAIENYYDQRGEYPESIEDLAYKYHIPKPSVMGIDDFRYERNGKAYNLSFIQWQHFGATEEIVMYNKNDDHTVKGHFASYNARKPHWKYYWLD